MCGRYITPGGSVHLRRGTKTGTAHLSGVQSCGNLASCPVCGPRIRHERALEIQTAGRRHTEEGGGLLFATFTVPHDRGMGLAGTWDLIRDGFSGMLSGRARAELRDRFGVQGFIRATEVTHGGAGWHPHLHVLLFVDAQWTDTDRVVDLWRWLHERWARAVVRNGGRPPSLTRGVQVIPCRADNDALGTYLAKIATETARADSKVGRAGSRTPMQILADHAEHHQDRDLELFREWMRAARGRRLIEWSRGLRGALGLADVTDQAVVDTPGEPTEIVCSVTREAWGVIQAEELVPELLDATSGGLKALAHAVHRWGLPVEVTARNVGPPRLGLRPVESTASAISRENRGNR